MDVGSDDGSLQSNHLPSNDSPYLPPDIDELSSDEGSSIKAAGSDRAAPNEPNEVDHAVPHVVDGVVVVMGGGDAETAVIHAPPPKLYSWFHPYGGDAAVMGVMVEQHGCSYDDNERLKRTEAAQKMDWLCPELCEKVDAANPVMGVDIDGEGTVNQTQLMESLGRVLGNFKRQAYCNVYQLRDMVEMFASRWGFHVKTRQCSIVCHFGKEKMDRSVEYENTEKAKSTSPSSKRRKSAPDSALECGFIIETTYIESDARSKKLERWRRPVRIKEANLKHSCGCSALQQTFARKKSGYYTKSVSEDDLEDILVLMESGCTSTNVFRRMMEKLGYKGGIQAVDVHNLKVRAQQLRVGGKKL